MTLSCIRTICGSSFSFRVYLGLRAAVECRTDELAAVAAIPEHNLYNNLKLISICHVRFSQFVHWSFIKLIIVIN